MDVFDRSLMCFLEVARLGSIAKASASLHVASSAISRHIARLEQDLDQPLFERKARGMRLTAAGGVLAEAASRWRSEHARTLAELRSMRGDDSVTVRLASTEGFALDFLPRVLADFHADRPRVRFALQVVGAEMVADTVRTGTVDVGLTFSVHPERDIRIEYSAANPIMALVRVGHPLAGRESVDVAELGPYPLALADSGATVRQLFEICCSVAGVRLKPALTTNQACSLHSYVARTNAVTIVGQLTAAARLHTSGLVGIPIRNPAGRHRTVQVQTLAGRELTPLLRQLVDRLAAGLAWLGEESAGRGA